MNNAATAAVIAEHCKELRLPTVLAEYPGLARQAQDGNWSYETFLHELLEREIIKRRENTSQKRLKDAKFPD